MAITIAALGGHFTAGMLRAASVIEHSAMTKEQQPVVLTRVLGVCHGPSHQGVTISSRRSPTYKVGPDFIQNCLDVAFRKLKPLALVHQLLNLQNFL